jgi:predicted nucleic acid-binding Zn ribbon protein
MTTKRSERPRMKSAASAKSLILDLLRKRGFEDKIREYRAWELWDETVGPQISARTKPVRIRDGILEVRVDHPVWMQQLQLLKPKILTRLNERLDGAVIKDLFLRRGAVEAKAEIVREPAGPPSWQSLVLSESEEEAIEKMVSPLDDPETRERLKRLLRRQKQLEKSRLQKD